MEPPPTSAPSASLAARFFSAYGQEIVIACAIVALFVIVSAINPRFLGANNLNTIISGNAYIAVAAIGMSMIIITGNIDVSVGALIGVLATISGTLAVSGYPIWVAWIAARSSSAPPSTASSASSSPTAGCPRSSSPSACSRSCAAASSSSPAAPGSTTSRRPSSSPSALARGPGADLVHGRS